MFSSSLRSMVAARVPATLVAAALGFSALSGCKSGAPPAGAGAPQGPLPVQVATAVQQDVPIVGNWVATTDGYVNAQIQPQVSGYLVRQVYKEGSEVRKGQVLFQIDPRTFQASLDQAKGQLAQANGQVGQAQAQLELAGINVKRDTPLAQAHAIAQSQLDTDTQTEAVDKASVASAQAAVASAQAQVETAQLNLGFTQVRSLIDGIAGQAQVQVGNLVSPSSVLTQVSQVNPIKVFFYISEQEYLALAAQSKTTGQGDLLSGNSKLPLKLTLSNNKVYSQTGHIIFVDRSVSAQTGSIRLAASFANPGNLLRPGQFGRITADTTVLHNAVLVPQRAVTELQGLNQIYVVGADNAVHVRTVTLGSQVGQKIIIASGIQGGDTVVVEGLDKLKDGMKVSPQPESPSAPEPAQTPQGN
jgi:membrane fusion protein (multidrug efflux system)